MRFISIFLLSLSLCFASILSLNEAFNIKSNSYNSSISIDINLGKDIYLYSNKLKLYINEKDISSLINLPQSIKKDNENIYDQNINLALPNLLLERFVKNEINLIKLEFQGCSKQGLCYNPQTWYFDLEYNNNTFKISKPYKMQTTKQEIKIDSEENAIAHFLATDNLFWILLSFFGYGLLLSLTPCILPMIPILSSLIVTKIGSNTSKKHSFFLSFIYVFFMSLAYALAGVIASILGASLQGILQKPIILILFALIFIIFAFAMFGVFRFELPLKFQNFIHKKSEKGKGILGIATMGFLSALIVGPCVAAPLAGALIYIANTGNALLGASALFIMSFGMGIPLLFIGLGLGFLKPDYWMQKVKIFFGFIMLAMAIWILSRIIKIDYILIAYGILGVFFSVFMGIFEKSYTTISKIKKSILILVLTYSLSLFLGEIFGSKNILNPFNINFNPQSKSILNYTYINTLEQLKEEIQTNTKPLMLDFTASWCENCKLLDELTFSDERIIKKMQNYKLIKIDVSENNSEQIKIMKEFQVFGPPVLIFFKNQEEKLKITGFINTNDLLQKLEQL
ncbi:protein-disulfide reductase DsbD [Campylobacter hepaticus]|uniref:Protein-disulfide reductase DsbD n=1 Tax=Campylobacter hepaticus TaxID=1813019 RepID=A0A6A7JTK0_9BACT|nr:protein-disulfide reductase DsbD [Campylobacter hepaticus]AXP08796.1 protein-disulfide reductase DsbD [Campylobacter hepaticus]MCZ0772647.1 protein-disulfide reductase DsbD [Campylobacter hepaticus]MCZ0774115.1 protein-disulfide reductase DsbD [Campylobacter hepaticus]MCZ0775367.1 protein-disulfide reductase DsbD [Campylobacter hepaticus]MPV53652.1 protein-disulfide reductase DsbD [Campylobacter hepaticus]